LKDASRTTGAARLLRFLARSAVLLLLGLTALAVVAWWTMGRMPGANPSRLPPWIEAERELAAELRHDLHALSVEIGERNTRLPENLARAADLVHERFATAGYSVEEEVQTVDGVVCRNVLVEIPGASEEIVIVGAHYDSALGSPGANDNGTGVAALLALARALRGVEPRRTLRLVAFANEEPPHFGTSEMGSALHARGCAARGERVAVMLSLETLGCYSDERGSQTFPVPGLDLVYSDRGDYVVFVGNVASRTWVRSAVGTFRRSAGFPCEGAALPEQIPGVGWSDQLWFWRSGWPGLMATDTAPFRDAHYHTSRDTLEHVDVERLARVVRGIEQVVRDWVGATP
jgi:hypothetical protein